ncbi:hypothetical protein L484_022032 [Morus notabilis]|uniref:Uncharacterized protein n=1 Tax=Morus notabilis TaxID=981085 RepID=W9RPI0_9ROSA|nr:hypothetical protein L484_022032 [Morus notabilis]
MEDVARGDCSLSRHHFTEGRDHDFVQEKKVDITIISVEDKIRCQLFRLRRVVALSWCVDMHGCKILWETMVPFSIVLLGWIDSDLASVPLLTACCRWIFSPSPTPTSTPTPEMKDTGDEGRQRETSPEMRSLGGYRQSSDAAAVTTPT